MIDYTMRGVPPSINTFRGTHWGKRDASNKEWQEKSMYSYREQDGTEVEEPASIECLFFPRDRRCPDVSNFCIKGIIDGLVNIGVLTDDSPKYLRSIKKEIGDFCKDDPHTRVIIFSSGIGRSNSNGGE